MNWFRYTSGITFLLTGLVKIWSGFGHSPVLTIQDPIFDLQFVQLMTVAGFVELAIGGLCFYTKRDALAIFFVAWLSSVLLLYRLCLWKIGWHRPCACLGNLTDALHISPQLADNIMKVVLAYLLIGSYGILIWEWTRRRQMRKSENRESGNVEGGARANNSLSADLPIADSQ